MSFARSFTTLQERERERERERKKEGKRDEKRGKYTLPHYQWCLGGGGGRRTGGGGDGNVNLEIHFTSALFLSVCLSLSFT